MDGRKRLFSFLALSCFMLGAGVGPGVDNASSGSNATNSTSGHCSAPLGIANASTQPCIEGRSISPGQGCTPKCESGFLPTETSLNCSLEGLQPPGFLCEDACAMQRANVPRAAGPHAARLCGHVSCGALAVMHGKGLAMVALALLGHVPCRDIRTWERERVLARTDVLVVSSSDFEGAPTDILQQQGFTGVVILVDPGCDMQEPSSLSSEDLRRRLNTAGVSVPGLASHSELVELFLLAGMPPAVPPALRCWEPRTIYLGADRGAGMAYAAMVEVPPGSQSLLRDVELKRLKEHLEILRQDQRHLAPATSKPKLLAYLAFECLPEAEAFFDLAFEALGDLAAVEALGDCYGSHPEARPQACSGSSWAGPCWEARSDAVAALAPYRFALAFEVSAESAYKCPRHVGSSILIPALIAGAVPVYRGPLEAYEAVNLSAVVHIPWNVPRKQAVVLFREAVDDIPRANARATAAAIPGSALTRWFEWDVGLQALPTNVGLALVAALETLAMESPHGRCLAHAQTRVGSVGYLTEL